MPHIDRQIGTHYMNIVRLLSSSPSPSNRKALDKFDGDIVKIITPSCTVISNCVETTIVVSYTGS